MEYGCIGEHLTHSFSKEIHNLMTDYDYVIREVAKEELDTFMKQRDFKAINVTIPYKQDVIPYLSYIEPQAEAIHAVNTVVNRDGKLFGYNTDYYGMSRLLERIGLNLQDKKVLILGTGGTSLTARAVAMDAGARWVIRTSRNPQQADTVTYSRAIKEYKDAQIIINTTPCGMFPQIGGMPIDPADFPGLEGVADAIYNPLRSRLVLKARAMGLPAEGGLYMLVAQAARAAEHFLNTCMPAETTDRVFRQLMKQKENIVLVGMPGCGKTTVGKGLAAALNRPFVDLDDEIVKVIGCSVSRYFAQHSEQAFREVEAKVAAECIAPLTGAVIATGGGAVLRDDNVDALRANGRLSFIDRPLEQLVATDDRPTANSAEALEKRFRERYARYCAVCDVHIASDGIPAHVIQQIEKEFLQ